MKMSLLKKIIKLKNKVAEEWKIAKAEIDDENKKQLIEAGIAVEKEESKNETNK